MRLARLYRRSGRRNPDDPPRQQGCGLCLATLSRCAITNRSAMSPATEGDPAGADRMNDVIRRFPDSRYAVDAKLKRDLVTDHLAGRKWTWPALPARRQVAVAAEAALPQCDRQVPDHPAACPGAHRRWSIGTSRSGIPRKRRRTPPCWGNGIPAPEWYEAGLSPDGVHAPGTKSRAIGAPAGRCCDSNLSHRLACRPPPGR